MEDGAKQTAHFCGEVLGSGDGRVAAMDVSQQLFRGGALEGKLAHQQVEQGDAQAPDVSRRAEVGGAGQHFGGCCVDVHGEHRAGQAVAGSIGANGSPIQQQKGVAVFDDDVVRVDGQVGDAAAVQKVKGAGQLAQEGAPDLVSACDCGDEGAHQYAVHR